MGFWSKLFGRTKTAEVVETVEIPTVTPQPEPVTPVPTIEEVEKQVEDLLRDLFPGSIETYEAEQKPEADALEEKKRKRSEAAKKAAATRAAKKAEGYDSKAVDGDGDGMVQDGTIWERPATPKKSKPKKK
jgi:flagellar biosynthesis/type III secretory pathway protein FliH